MTTAKLKSSSSRTSDDVVELIHPPAFEEGQKVRALRTVRNDGTYPGVPTGTEMIQAGDVGYVKSIGTYLQMYYIYAIDFYERRIVVGMRAKELELVDSRCNDPK
ncbi:nitrogen fixation protein NifZ [Azospirillum fermentarium]|uniref:nitrogen fixation protein NifZ n=1 Tax=Azospirillum fermentarium TaxID=1233114 RepID=UPI00222652B8|nr:nitrogen fixation protein NifZ [Azospirillum fermentarium]MCW2245975.1 nitrogen fixation protein NifZ [Azospirillum fermentarium]